MIGINDLGELIGELVPSVNTVLGTMNDRLVEMRITISQANDLLGEQNRKNLSSTLVRLNSLLAENRPKVTKTMDNLQAASDQLPPVLTNVKAASEQVGTVFRGTPQERVNSRGPEADVRQSS